MDSVLSVKKSSHEPETKICWNSWSRRSDGKLYMETQFEGVWENVTALQHLVDSRQMALLKEPFDKWRKVFHLYFYSQDWMESGGRILWNAIAVSKTQRPPGKWVNTRWKKRIIQRTNNTVWSTDWISSVFTERSDEDSQSWRESIVKNLFFWCEQMYLSHAMLEHVQLFTVYLHIFAQCTHGTCVAQQSRLHFIQEESFHVSRHNTRYSSSSSFSSVLGSSDSTGSSHPQHSAPMHRHQKRVAVILNYLFKLGSALIAVGVWTDWS